jgi:hypothetical protein
LIRERSDGTFPPARSGGRNPFCIGRAVGIVAAVSLILCASASAQSKPSAPAPEILGAWEGESKCTIPDAPCHDEHVIYEIAADKNKAASAPLKMDGYKVVKGERIFMGSLHCDYDSPKKTLACTFRGRSFDDWQFTLAGATLQGTLTVDAGKTLYRKITVSKKLAR